MFDSIIIGCGFAGAVMARELAEKNKKVLIVDQRDHIGGNCFDEKDSYGILVHKYGPHIFHTYSEEVYRYLSRFTDWYLYEHEVAGKVDDKYLPIPFNLNTLFMVYGEEKGEQLKRELTQAYGEEARVPILELREHASEGIREIAEYVYQNVFLQYTMKQWGQTPEEIDATVSGRVPVLVSYDNRYFQDNYQGLPLNGYTELFHKLLDHPNITVSLNTPAKEILTIQPEAEQQIWYRGKPFAGDVVYTGALDELFECKYGQLPYRTLRFQFEHYDTLPFQGFGVVNYTVSEKYTRITEFKHLTGQMDGDGTTIVKEYPLSYDGKKGETPYYAIINKENQKLYQRYVALVEGMRNFHLLGRLAEYKYYNIDAIVEKALQLSRRL